MELHPYKDSKPGNAMSHKPFVSIVTPAFNEAENLPILYGRLCSVLDTINTQWEWIVVDDHSTDNTFEVLSRIAEQDDRVSGFRLSRNSGSHIAIRCGLNNVGGGCAVVMAADLQDPPETLPELLQKWQGGAQVVWATRDQIEGVRKVDLVLGRLFWSLMRRLAGMKELPATGADFFLIDRLVLDYLCQFHETNFNLIMLLSWMGFKQETVKYVKQARISGRSGWSFEKKLKVALDSFLSFSYLPIRLMSYAGIIAGLLGFVYAAVVFINFLTGSAIQGWTSLMIVILIFGGIQMLMMGLLGEYLWRTMSEAHRRPPYLVEAILGKHTHYPENIAPYPKEDIST